MAFEDIKKLQDRTAAVFKLSWKIVEKERPVASLGMTKGAELSAPLEVFQTKH